MLIDPALADPLQAQIEELGLQPIRLRIATRQVDTDKLPYLVWIADADDAERLINASIRIAIAERLSCEPDWSAGISRLQKLRQTITGNSPVRPPS